MIFPRPYDIIIMENKIAAVHWSWRSFALAQVLAHPHSGPNCPRRKLIISSSHEFCKGICLRRTFRCRGNALNVPPCRVCPCTVFSFPIPILLEVRYETIHRPREPGPIPSDLPRKKPAGCRQRNRHGHPGRSPHRAG